MWKVPTKTLESSLTFLEAPQDCKLRRNLVNKKNRGVSGHSVWRA